VFGSSASDAAANALLLLEALPLAIVVADQTGCLCW